jgi:hypothetical protein
VTAGVEPGTRRSTAPLVALRRSSGTVSAVPLAQILALIWHRTCLKVRRVVHGLTAVAAGVAASVDMVTTPSALPHCNKSTADSWSH